MYKLEILNREQKTLNKLTPISLREQIQQAINNLANNPRPDGCMKLTNANDMWRIRVQHYRVGYRINDVNKTVTVMIIQHRNNFYPRGATH